MGIPRSIGDISVFAEIGQGPLTVVCKGYEQEQDRFVLLKILRAEFAGDVAIVSRLQEEARLAERIQHGNVVSVYSFGREANTVYISTEFVEGMDLHDLISGRSLPVDLAVFILKEIACGLQAAHEQSVLHRDLKPSNVMIGFSGQVKLTDFGFASLMGETSNEIRGTASYLAPEQIKGDAFTSSGDLFALGAIFFEMLVGHPAFLGQTTNDILDAVLNRNPGNALYDLASIPDGVSKLCNRLLSKNPEDRPPSAERVVTELHALSATPVDAAALEQYLLNPHEYEQVQNAGIIAVAPSESFGAADQDSNRPPTDARIPARRSSAIAISAVLIIVLALIGIWFVSGGIESENGSDFQLEEGNQITADNTQSIGIDSGAVDTAVTLAENDGEQGEMIDPSAVQTPVVQDQDSLLQYRNPDEAKPNVSSDSSSIEQTEPPVQTNSIETKPGLLHVDSVPWAVLYVDGDSVATTPLRARIPVLPGLHAIILRNPNFPDYHTSIVVESGQPFDLDVSLFSLVGQIYFEISPWAEVLVNEVVRDTIPPQDQAMMLAAGEYALQLRHPTLGTWQTSLLVEAGQTQRLQFNLFELLAQ